MWRLWRNTRSGDMFKSSKVTISFILIVKNYYISLTLSGICPERRIVYQEDYYYERHFTLICMTFLTRHFKTILGFNSIYLLHKLWLHQFCNFGSQNIFPCFYKQINELINTFHDFMIGNLPNLLSSWELNFTNGKLRKFR